MNNKLIHAKEARRLIDKRYITNVKQQEEVIANLINDAINLNKECIHYNRSLYEGVARTLKDNGYSVEIQERDGIVDVKISW